MRQETKLKLIFGILCLAYVALCFYACAKESSTLGCHIVQTPKAEQSIVVSSSRDLPEMDLTYVYPDNCKGNNPQEQITRAYALARFHKKAIWFKPRSTYLINNWKIVRENKNSPRPQDTDSSLTIYFNDATFINTEKENNYILELPAVKNLNCYGSVTFKSLPNRNVIGIGILPGWYWDVNGGQDINFHGSVRGVDLKALVWIGDNFSPDIRHVYFHQIDSTYCDRALVLQGGNVTAIEVRDLRVVHWNKYAVDLIGLTPTPIKDLFDPFDQKLNIEQISSIKWSQRVQSKNGVLYNKGGGPNLIVDRFTGTKHRFKKSDPEAYVFHCLHNCGLLVHSGRTEGTNIGLLHNEGRSKLSSEIRHEIVIKDFSHEPQGETVKVEGGNPVKLIRGWYGGSVKNSSPLKNGIHRTPLDDSMIGHVDSQNYVWTKK